MNVSLYRKYRPQNFASVVGQKAAVDVLTSSLIHNRPGHAYLFSGSRGCGKTSVARIFAKALNCQNPQGEAKIEPCGECTNCKAITAGGSMDVIEIDGASNNSVDQIRELKANVTLAPISSKYKIYIIDEVHMLTTAAFNALLKTLEEPPEHVIFIMATTEPQKVPVTIRSRCQHIPFHAISTQDIFHRLDEVCGLESVSAESEALWEIARQADGALRDALSLLEQVISAGEITLANVESVMGSGSRSSFERWVKTFRTDREAAYLILKSMFDSGASGVRVFEEMFSLVRNLWLSSRWENIAASVGASEQEQKFLREEAANWKSEDLHALLVIIMNTLTQARTGIRPDILLGVFLVMLEIHEDAPVTLANKAAHKKADDFPSVPVFTKDKSDKFEPIVPAVPTSDILPNMDIQVDEALREELCRIAIEDENLVILCAMFDARPYEQDSRLILDFEHRFSYDTLRVDQRAAEFPRLFTSYKSVILRYGPIETICPDLPLPSEQESEQTAPKPENHKTEPEPDTQIQDTVPSEQSSHEPDRDTSSVFDRVRRGLSEWGTKCEIVFTKSIGGSDDDDQDTESSDSDSESGSESESESEGE